MYVVLLHLFRTKTLTASTYLIYASSLGLWRRKIKNYRLIVYVYFTLSVSYFMWSDTFVTIRGLSFTDGEHNGIKVVFSEGRSICKIVRHFKRSRSWIRSISRAKSQSGERAKALRPRKPSNLIWRCLRHVYSSSITVRLLKNLQGESVGAQQKLQICIEDSTWRI